TGRRASKAGAAARSGRTHRAGAILALADISHVVVLDTDAGRGMASQADLAQAEVHDRVVVFRNDSWFGPVVQLSAPPRDPLSPGGLAAAATAAAPVPVTGWPSGPIEIGPAATTQGVVYVAGGPRAGWHIGNAKAQAGGGFLSSAWYCPPIGPGYVQQLAIANPNDRATQIVVRPSLDAAPVQRSLLAARSRITVSVKSDNGAVVETYGRQIAVA